LLRENKKIPEMRFNSYLSSRYMYFVQEINIVHFFLITHFAPKWKEYKNSLISHVKIDLESLKSMTQVITHQNLRYYVTLHHGIL
jgi:hypothetical protein